ncbi:MAG: hypothetical protein JSU92_02105 [Deltaproteobacteria bacterium]|nr:MAG: hypothetical protein JSU92_02105 [Deltaproteobacteria bacterium]
MRGRKESAWAIVIFAILIISGSMFACGNGDSSGKTYSAKGTYVYDSEYGELIVTWTETNFECAGPEFLGVEYYYVISIGATTMIWEDPYEYGQLTWTRPEGTEGVIEGTWTMKTDDGATWTMTLDGSNVALSTRGLDCSEGY